VTVKAADKFESSVLRCVCLVFVIHCMPSGTLFLAQCLRVAHKHIYISEPGSRCCLMTVMIYDLCCQ